MSRCRLGAGAALGRGLGRACEQKQQQAEEEQGAAEQRKPSWGLRLGRRRLGVTVIVVMAVGVVVVAGVTVVLRVMRGAHRSGLISRFCG